MTDTAALSALAADRRARLALAALLLGAVGIAFSPIFVRISEIGPTATAFWRVALALPVLALWMRASEGGSAARAAPARRRPQGWRDHGRLALAGAFFAGDLICWHWAIQYTSVANSTLFANFAPIFVTLGAFLLFRERVTRLFLAGLACGIGGAAILVSDSLGVGADTAFGDLLGLLTAMFYGAYILAIGRLRAEFPVATIMTWSGLTTAIVILPFAVFVFGEAIWPTTLTAWAILVALAWISHAGGQSLIAYALAHLPVAFSSVSLLLQPVIAALLAWLLLAEPVGPIQAIGGVVVLIGVLLARLGSRIGAAAPPPSPGPGGPRRG
jgi:drug/metabolite transporter (DMT)-like permease